MNRLLTADQTEIVSASDIAERFGVGPSAVSNWRRRRPDFPRPIATVAHGRIAIWLWADVVAWYRGSFTTEQLAILRGDA